MNDISLKNRDYHQGQGSMSSLRTKEPGMQNKPNKPGFDNLLHSSIGKSLLQCSPNEFTVIFVSFKIY